MARKSFFERLTGGVRLEDEESENIPPKAVSLSGKKIKQVDDDSSYIEEEGPEGQLSLDLYQTATEIVIQTFVAGVKPEDLQINITRDMVTVRGKREENKMIDDDNYFSRELYWGAFSRSVTLPAEVEPEEAEAIEKHGLLIIKLPKIDKQKSANLKVKSM